MRNLYSVLLALFILISCSQTKTTDGQTAVISNVDTILVGTYTSDSSQGIYALEFERETGAIRNVGLVAEAVNPSFLVKGAGRDILYSVNEVGQGGISAFKRNRQSGRYSLLNHVSSEGASPCHVSISNHKDVLSSSNYQSGNVVFYAINSDGSLADSVEVRQNEGETGPDKRQDRAHAHCGIFGKNDQYLYVVDLGLDKIVAYKVDSSGKPMSSHTAMKLDPGDGPRHLIFHPTLDMAFVINELSSTMVSMSVDHTTGTFKRIDKKSTLPEGFNGTNYCADLHMTANGKFLYGSNRGHNSIVVFEVSETGELSFLEVESTRGSWPRNFSISPDEKHLLVANQKTNNVTVFEIDKESGLLEFTGNEAKVFSPTCLIF